MELPQITEVRGIKVLTTRQLAEAYTTTQKVINNNFQEIKINIFLENITFLLRGRK